MIFDSLGLGELGIILILGILLLDPKRLGSVLRQVAQFRRKLNQIQNQVRSQLNTLVLEDELRSPPKTPGAGQADLAPNSSSAIPPANHSVVNPVIKANKSAMRQWAKTKVASLTSQERREKSAILTEALLAWPVYQKAHSLCAFVGTHDEIDTETLIRSALAAGKTVYLPYVIDSEEIGFCALRDFERDLSESRFGILEPRSELRQGEAGDETAREKARCAALTLVPGVAFDALGGRLGHGKGYYDRHLAKARTYALGLAFEAQVYGKKLPLDAHDKNLDALVTESRFLLFTDPPDASAAMANDSAINPESGPSKETPQHETRGMKA